VYIMGYENIEFEKDSIFLVTGGAGFIGSNLCQVLLDKGYKVRCLDNLSNGKQENVDLFIDNPNYTFIKGDIRDLDTCVKACEGVDYVFHQAAWGSVPEVLRCRYYTKKLILEEHLILWKLQDKMV